MCGDSHAGRKPILCCFTPFPETEVLCPRQKWLRVDVSGACMQHPPFSRHMTRNLLPLRLLEGVSPGRSRVCPGPSRPLRRFFARAPRCARSTASASAHPSAPEPAGGDPLSGDSPAGPGDKSGSHPSTCASEQFKELI